MLPFLLHQLESLTNQLVHLVMRRDAIKEADRILKLNEKWVKDVSNQLEEDLVDLDAATKDLFTKTQISVEKKWKFKNDCKQIVISIILRLQERSPLKYSIIRNSSALSPKQWYCKVMKLQFVSDHLLTSCMPCGKLKQKSQTKPKTSLKCF